MSDGTQLSVAVCTYNRAHMLPDVLRTLVKQTLAPSCYEILIIDNNSTDNTKQVVVDFAQKNANHNIRYIFEEKQGVSHARNAAYLSAQSDYVVFVDDDELADPNLLNAYKEAIARNPECAVFAGKILIQAPSNKPHWFSTYIEDWFGKYDFGPHPLEITLNNVQQKKIAPPNCGNMAIKVSLLQELDGFDPNLGRKQNEMLGGEETQVCLEALSRGYRIMYEPSAVIEHIITPERLTLSHIYERHFQAGKSYIRMRRWNGTLKPWIRFILGELSYLTRLCSKLLTSDLKRRFEIKLQLCFEMGAIQEYFGFK